MRSRVRKLQERELERIVSEATSYFSAYPDYHVECEEIPRDEQWRMVSLVLLNSGIEAAADIDWVRHRIEDHVRVVLVKRYLLDRLVGLLESEGDLARALDTAKKRCGDEYLAFDSVEDAIVTLVQRGHGARDQETLLRYFRQIVWEKLHDGMERVKRRRQVERQSSIDHDDAIRSATESAFSHIENTEIRDLVIAAICDSCLSSKAKAAFLLKYGEEWRSVDVGAAVDMRPDAVDRINHRTRSVVRQAIASQSTEATARVPLGNYDQVVAIASELPSPKHQAIALLRGYYGLSDTEAADACGSSKQDTEQVCAYVRSRLESEGENEQT